MLTGLLSRPDSTGRMAQRYINSRPLGGNGKAIFVGHRRVSASDSDSVLFSMSLDIQIFVCVLSRSKLCQALLKKLLKATETTSDLVAIQRGSFAQQTNWETLSTPPIVSFCPALLN